MNQMTPDLVVVSKHFYIFPQIVLAPRKCLIIGDSMLQKVNPEGWEDEAFYFAYSGIKAKQLTQQIKV